VKACLAGSGKYSLEGKAWGNVSPAAKDLLSHMLEVEPRARWSAAELLKHAWFKENLGKASVPAAAAAGGGGGGGLVTQEGPGGLGATIPAAAAVVSNSEASDGVMSAPAAAGVAALSS
jgi:hypothetical protein